MESKKIDSLIQTHCFGPWDEGRCRVCGWPLAKIRAEGCRPNDCSMRPGPDRRADEPAPYSTDIAAAWRVVEKMGELGWHFNLNRLTMISPFAGSLSNAQFYCPRGPCELHGNKENNGHGAEREAGTAPMAICLAALKALGVEVPEGK